MALIHGRGGEHPVGGLGLLRRAPASGVSEGPAQQGVGVFVGRRHMHAELREGLRALGRRRGVATDGEVDDGVTLALECLDGVGAVAAEEREVLLQVDVDRLAVLQPLQLVDLPVVLRPVLQAAACEVAEGLDERRAKVVAVAMLLRCIVAVDIQRRPLEAIHARRQSIEQVLVEQLRHFRVVPRRRREVDVADAVPDEAQRVAPDPLLPFGHHVLPEGVLREGPGVQDAEHVVLAHLPVRPPRRLQRLLRLALRDQTVGSHDQRLAAALADVQVRHLEPKVPRELAAVPFVDRLVHI
mmetsp:Transcript_111440/g.320154  ORF Transcript_111440/g.320154 Transcript_111440/m.320154 type:complete len:298 (+) Transcript_111440:397-1290(+)